MKILFLAVGGKYGSDKSLINLVSVLKRRGLYIHVVINKADGLEKELSDLDIPYTVFRLGLGCYESPHCLMGNILLLAKLGLNLLRHVVAYRKMKRLVRSFNPDIIHTNVGIFTTGFYVAKACGIPHVWHLREYEDLDFNLKFIGGKEYYISRLKCDNNYSIAISKRILNHYKLQDVDKAAVVYNGILDENAKELTIQTIRKQNYFLYVGNVTEQKGVSDMIEAFCEIRDLNNHELWICGDCTMGYKTELFTQYASRSNFEKVRFLGYQEKVDFFLKGATALIVPSFFEALGRTMIEAMSNECIVVGRNTAGLKEQFENGVDFCGQEIGFRFNNVAELADVLSRLCKDRSSFEKMKLNAKNTVYHYYTRERYTEQVYEIYENIL